MERMIRFLQCHARELLFAGLAAVAL
jgi:hypothetical protein